MSLKIQEEILYYLFKPNYILTDKYNEKVWKRAPPSAEAVRRAALVRLWGITRVTERLARGQFNRNLRLEGFLLRWRYINPAQEVGWGEGGRSEVSKGF